MRKLLAVILGVVLFMQTLYSMPASASPISVDQSVRQNGYELTINRVSFDTRLNEYFSPDDGNIYFSVDLSLKSNANGGVDANPFYASVKDTDGFVYTMNVFGRDPQLPSQNSIPRGEKVRGWVTFEIPQGLRLEDLTFEYKPLSFTDNILLRVPFS